MEVGQARLTAADAALLESAVPRAVIRRAGPRLVRDGLGPLATFYVGWKLFGLTWGIALAVAFGVTVLLHERRQGRPAALVRVALAIVCLRAFVGLTSGSASVYLAQEIGIDLLLATAFLGSLAAGRPVSAWIAQDVFPFTAEMRDSNTFREVMRTVTTVWGVYFLLRAAVRFAALVTLSTDQYVLVIAVSDAPFLIGLLAWSVYWTFSAFRRSEEWGALLAQDEAHVPAPPGGAPAGDAPGLAARLGDPGDERARRASTTAT